MFDEHLMEEVLAGELSPAGPKTYAHSPDACPSNHWNDGNDTCEDCGMNLNESEETAPCQGAATKVPQNTERKPLSDKQKYQAAARELYHKCGELEIDDDPTVSAGEDPGAYVAAWVWVSNEEAGVQPEYWHPKSIWDDHPAYPGEDWRYECDNGDTRLGYIAWVNAKLAENDK